MNPRVFSDIHPRMRRYLSCENCRLQAHRRNVVIGMGDIPCDVLFIAEAPGKAENLLGIPLVGPSGRIFDEAVRVAKVLAGIGEDRIISLYKTHVVLCRPCDGRNEPNRPPTNDEVIACFRRLEAEAVLSNPKRVVLLGQTVKRHVGKLFPGALVLPHPDNMVYLGGTQHPVFHQFCRELSVVFSALYPQRTPARRNKPCPKKR